MKPGLMKIVKIEESCLDGVVKGRKGERGEINEKFNDGRRRKSGD